MYTDPITGRPLVTVNTLQLAEADFVEMVNRHDLTFSYSDDSGCLRRGAESLAQIKSAAKALDPDFVRATWNAKVDRTLAEGYRETFYWRG